MHLTSPHASPKRDDSWRQGGDDVNGEGEDYDGEPPHTTTEARDRSTSSPPKKRDVKRDAKRGHGSHSKGNHKGKGRSKGMGKSRKHKHDRHDRHGKKTLSTGTVPVAATVSTAVAAPAAAATVTTRVTKADTGTPPENERRSPMPKVRLAR